MRVFGFANVSFTLGFGQRHLSLSLGELLLSLGTGLIDTVMATHALDVAWQGLVLPTQRVSTCPAQRVGALHQAVSD